MRPCVHVPMQVRSGAIAERVGAEGVTLQVRGHPALAHHLIIIAAEFRGTMQPELHGQKANLFRATVYHSLKLFQSPA